MRPGTPLTVHRSEIELITGEPFREFAPESLTANLRLERGTSGTYSLMAPRHGRELADVLRAYAAAHDTEPNEGIVALALAQAVEEIIGS